MSRWSALANAHKPWRAALGCEVETRSKKGARQPRIKRLIGFDELSPKSEGRKRTVGAMPVTAGMMVSGCSTITQSASAHRHRRTSAMPQKARPSRRFW
eukprot:6175497-Pleurochrysis_carterae.AAC.1